MTNNKLAGRIAVAIILIVSGFLIFSQIRREKSSVVPVQNIEKLDKEESVEFPKTMTYLTATVTEARENEILVSGMVSKSDTNEVTRRVIKGEKIKVVKILADDYQEVEFGDIKKGDYISVGTFDDFINNESVLALTISIYPASNE